MEQEKTEIKSQPESGKWTLNPLSIIDIFLILFDFYAVILILVLGGMLFPHRYWVIELLSNFLHLGLVPSIFVIITALFRRKKRSVILWTIPTLAFLILFGGLFLPSLGSRHACESRRAPSCVHLKVMTWNLRGNTLSGRPEQIDIIRATDADIITLQEVNRGIIDEIEASLSSQYPYRLLYPAGVGGTGILSKYPISDEEYFPLPPGALFHSRATIDLDGVPITVISAHPPPPLSVYGFRFRSARYREITALLEMIPEDTPALLMGDLNLTDQSSVYTVLTDAGMHDAHREVGWGFGSTWPIRLQNVDRHTPVLRLDYIWHTEDFHAHSIRRGPRSMSDHLPVIAELVFEP